MLLFLHKSAYYNDFWRSCDTEIMMLKIQLYITGINYIKKYIQINEFF